MHCHTYCHVLEYSNGSQSQFSQLSLFWSGSRKMMRLFETAVTTDNLRLSAAGPRMLADTNVGWLSISWVTTTASCDGGFHEEMILSPLPKGGSVANR